MTTVINDNVDRGGDYFLSLIKLSDTRAKANFAVRDTLASYVTLMASGPKNSSPRRWLLLAEIGYLNFDNARIRVWIYRF